MKRFLAFAIFILTLNLVTAQSVYVTSTGGDFGSEKWMSITTGPNGTGTQVWGQGNGTYGNGQGRVTDVQVDVSNFCGQTLYVNAYDRYDDGWDGTTYTVYDSPGQTGTLLANNGGQSPDSGEDDDCASSSWCTTDPASELEVSEAFTATACPCTFPVASYMIAEDCSNGQFSIDVNVSSIGDATGVDISDGTTTYETNVNTGTYTVGPFSAGSSQTIAVNGTNYGGCDISSTPLTEDCACTSTPIAIVNAINLDCNNATFAIQVTVTSFGDGSSADIYVDGSLEQANASLSTAYSFPGNPVGQYDVEIRATGGSFVTCNTMYQVSESCNGADLCVDAADITNGCQIGDLGGASIDGGALVEDRISCGNGNSIARCGFNPSFTGSSYSRTDHADLWYQVSPNGSNQVTININNLSGGNLMVLPYLSSGGCPSTVADNTTLEGNIGNGGITNGSCPNFTSDGSLTLSGPNVASASVIYLRVMAFAPNGSGATNCQTLTYPTFEICTSVPQANDICNDAIDIDGTTTAGDFCSASTESESAETCNSSSGCNACTESSETNDLWYTVSMDPGDDDQKLELDLTFQGASDAVVVTLYSGCFNNSQLDVAGVADCATVSSTGAGSTVTYEFASVISANGAGPDYYIRVAPAAGNGICNFDIEARRVAENNNCSVFQNVFPGFDIESNQDLDFSFASNSNAVPVTAGNDLWYAFDPMSGTDNGINVYSSTADVVVSGLSAGQELTVLVYRGNTVSANNCSNLSSNYLSSLTISSNGTETFSCLDVTQGSADGGYLVRIVQTAGASPANATVRVEPSSPGKFNTTCSNIWSGTGPTSLGVSDPAHGFNPYYILDGETINADFTGATGCDANITSSDCNGVSNDPATAANARNLWYIFRVPDSNCPALGSSSVVTDMDITYNAGNAARDAKVYVYSNCSSALLQDCSPTLDGAGETWTVSGLTQGEFYLLRVMPNAINSDYDYTFDISIDNGTVRPCNNEAADAENLSVTSCNDYLSLNTYSMQGADASAGTGIAENDVWFTFTAPSPANGGPYSNANKSWVTIFLENESGTSSGPLSVQLYTSPTSRATAASTYSTSNTALSQAYAQFGHLTPGQQYFLRVYHKENQTAAVDYKISAYTPNANETAWSCGTNSASISGCSEGCDDLREAYFKIDLPEGAPSNLYYMIEVVGDNQILDFELRSQHLSEASALEGGFNDFDHPCSSRALEPGVSISSTTPAITSPTTNESCNGGEGVRRVYFGMNGPAAGMKDYYYIKVFMDPSDPNFASSTSIDICAINFFGPYTTQTLAEAGGPGDANCAQAPLSVDLVDFDGQSTEKFDVLSWRTSTEIDNSHFVIEQSTDGVVYKAIGSVDGYGTTNSPKDYVFRHQKTDNSNYYRLKQFDFDGTSTLSNVIYLESKSDLGLSIYPNPSDVGAQFVVQSKDLIQSWEIRSLTGVLIQKQENVSLNRIEIQGINQSGLYTISLQIGGQTVNQKLIIQ